MQHFWIAVDLAKKVDYTAVAIVTYGAEYDVALRCYDEAADHLYRAERKPKHYDKWDLEAIEEQVDALAARIPDPGYQVVQAYRLPLGTEWGAVKRHLRQVVTAPRLRDRCQLVVDASGVGDPVVEDLRETGLSLRAVTITGPQARERRFDDRPDDWSVPKRDLLARTRVLLDNGRLKIAKSLPFADTLVEELLGFEYDTTAAGNQVFRHREGEHDDLVLSLCLALWDASKGEQRGDVNGSLVAVAGEKVRDRDLFTLDDWFLEAPERGEKLFEGHGEHHPVTPWTPLP